MVLDAQGLSEISAANSQTQTTKIETYGLTDLGYKIFLDRYAHKDMDKNNLSVGNVVIVVQNGDTDMSSKREIGIITDINHEKDRVTVITKQGEELIVRRELIDRPLEIDPKQMHKRIAKGVASVEKEKDQPEWQKRFEEVLDDWKFVPGGRIMAMAGTGQNLTPFNCYVINSPHDSRGGIMDTLTEMAEIMAHGGGVGINISSLRPEHAYVKGVNGRSSGSVSWGDLYSVVTGKIEQGGSRRGALLMMLADWHPDVLEFINSKRKSGKIINANISVGISDDFMEAVKTDKDWNLKFPDTAFEKFDEEWDGDILEWESKGYPVQVYRTVKARDIWGAIIESAWDSAEPGMLFIERANKMSNSAYYEEGKLISTNPCVTGDTLIYTDKGMIPAKELFDDETDIEVVIDGRFGLSYNTSRSSRVFMTGEKQVYKLRTKEGYKLRATANHQIMTPNGWIELGDLEEGDKIHILNRKGGFGEQGSLEDGRLIGWIVADGFSNEDKTSLTFFGEKKELSKTFAGYVNTKVIGVNQNQSTIDHYAIGIQELPERDEERIVSTRLSKVMDKYGIVEDKHQIPEAVWRGTEDMQRGYLQSLFTADGGIQGTREKGQSIRLSQVNLEFLRDVQKILLNFGIASRLYANRRDAGYRSLPDGKGGTKEYWCQADHELVISRRNLKVFSDEIGFLLTSKQSVLDEVFENRKRGLYAESFLGTVIAIEEDGFEEVFDLTEPMTHSFIANGITVHNCGEQFLAANSVCNLGAINLDRFSIEDFSDSGINNVNWRGLSETIHTSVRFLDNVIDHAYFWDDRYEDQQKSERRVGLGVMGLADLMIRCGVRYGSEEGIKFIDSLFKFIARESYIASSNIAKEKGSFKFFEADGFLNSGFMAGMDDEVRDLIREQGIRNVTINTVAPTGSSGTMVGVSTGLEPYFNWEWWRQGRLGWHKEEAQIVQEWRNYYDYSEEELPEYFVNAMELTPKEHVNVLGAIQRWIDSSLSKTCNVPNDYTVEQTAELYMYMYDLGAKGGTIYRDGSRDEQVLHNVSDASSDEGDGDGSLKLETGDGEGGVKIGDGDDKLEKLFVANRPQTLTGKTFFTQTPFGKAYITINEDPESHPFEVFITIGKAGSDSMAQAEVLGRLLSTSLQMVSDSRNRREALSKLVNQMLGVGGSRPWGFGPNRVLSFEDAIAQGIRKHYLDIQISTENLPPEHEGQVKLQDEKLYVAVSQDQEDVEVYEAINFKNADRCPECGNTSLVRIEGCKKCFCGYSEC